jgi:hypothetical protein
MIKFKLYSKSPKDMTDKEAKEAKYKDTSKPSFIKLGLLVSLYFASLASLSVISLGDFEYNLNFIIY